LEQILGVGRRSGYDVRGAGAVISHGVSYEQNPGILVFTAVAKTLAEQTQTGNLGVM